jgi:RNA polymerase sigma-70 factor (ECF subfamily)
MPGFLKSLFSATDEQLMWRVKLDDDADAFAQLMSRWQKPIQNLCIRMLGDVHRAEDVAQSAFARIFTSRVSWEPTAKFSTFLWKIALNLCHDELRGLKRRNECSILEDIDNDLDGMVSELPGPDLVTDARERAEIVREALQKLSPHYREVVVLRHYQHLKFHEIAQVLDIPEGTAKSRMAEALTKLSSLLTFLNENKTRNQNTQSRELLTL